MGVIDLLRGRKRGCRRNTVLMFFTVVGSYFFFSIFANQALTKMSQRLGNADSMYEPSTYVTERPPHLPAAIPPRIGEGLSPCRLLHIGMRSENAEQSRDIADILKQQLYLDPQSSFHLHISASPATQASLTTLLNTWELDRVAVSFYSLASPRLYDSIPVILKNLPQTVHNILFIDGKMRFIKGVSELFDSLSSHPYNDIQFIGYVQSRRKKARHDCVVCVHDVLMVDVHKARHRSSFSSPNILAELTPADVVQLPLSWYVELDSGFPFETLQTLHDISAFKLSARPTDYYDNLLIVEARELSDLALHADGDAFGHRKHQCPAPGGQEVRQIVPSEKVKCREYRNEAQLSRRTHLYFIGSIPVSSGPTDISLLTQCTLDRLSSLRKMVNRWEGPLHVLVSVGTDRDAGKLVAAVAADTVLRARANLAFHVVYKRKTYYPINFFRNVLLNVTTTPYLLFVDVDLIPSTGMYKLLQGHVQHYLQDEQQQASSNGTIGLVIPAFEQFLPVGDPPTDRADMLASLTKGTVVGYRMQAGWKDGHKATDYDKWKMTMEPYYVPYRGAFEPYVVLSTKQAPQYDERVFERMADKIIYGLELLARGYKFLILHDCFITHYPHATSEGTMTWKHVPTYGSCAVVLSEEFKRELPDRFPGFKLP